MLGHDADKDYSEPDDKEAHFTSKRTTVLSKKEQKARLAGDINIYAYYAKAVGWLLALYFCLQAATTFLMKFPDVWLGW